MASAMNHKKRSRRGHQLAAMFDRPRRITIMPQETRKGFMQRLMRAIHGKERAVSQDEG